MESKSLQNRFRSGFGRALNEDSVSKLKEERSASVRGDQTGRILGSGKGEPGRGLNCPHTLTTLSKDKGSADFVQNCQTIRENAPNAIPERAQVGSRWPLKSTWESGTCQGVGNVGALFVQCNGFGNAGALFVQ